MNKPKTGREFLEDLDRILHASFSSPTEKHNALTNEVSAMLEGYRRKEFTTFERVKLIPMARMTYAGVCHVCRTNVYPGERGYLWYTAPKRAWTYCAPCGDEVCPSAGQDPYFSMFPDEPEVL